jgi:phage baseplate assembly protein W
MANTLNLKFPLRKSSEGAFEGNSVTIDAIKDNLKILLLTNYGERPIQYDFGANLRKVLFNEPGVDIKQKIKDQIAAAVEKWMPFVKIEQMIILGETDDVNIEANKIRVKIHFSVGQLSSVLEQTI